MVPDTREVLTTTPANVAEKASVLRTRYKEADSPTKPKYGVVL
jgi:hypothetical protein